MGLVAAAWVAAAATAYTAVESHKARKDQASANAKAEAEAKKAQDEQEALATEEAAAADVKLEEQRSRILKGQKGRGGLLFDSELGVTDDSTKSTTLGG